MILSVIGLIALAVVIMTPDDDGPRYPGRKINVEDLISLNFKPKKFNRTWVSGESKQTRSLNMLKAAKLGVYNDCNKSISYGLPYGLQS